MNSDKLNTLLNQDAGSDLTSSRYSPVKTAALVDVLEAAGFEIASTQATAPRKDDRQGFQKHMLRIRRSDLTVSLDGVQPEIILINAHDGTSSVRVMLGLFRFVCLNGLVVGKTLDEHRVRHVGNALAGALEAVNAVTLQIPKLEAAVKRLASIKLTQQQELKLATEIGNAILKDKSNVVNFVPQSLLTRRRHQDYKSDAFTVLNAIQENALKGGLQYSTLEFDERNKREYTQKRRMRTVKSIDRQTSINRLVWDATERAAA